jgi:hypothetical protein
MGMTLCSLFTMIFTTPGMILVGFKLRASVMLGSVGLVLTVMTSDLWIAANEWHVIHSRVLNTQAGWLTLAWLVILVPYTKTTKTRLKMYAEIYRGK